VRLLWVFWVYNKEADPSDVVIEKQGFSTFDTHEPAIAMSLSTLCLNSMPVDPVSHRNEIFLLGRHQEVCRFVSSGLVHTSHQSVVIPGCHAMKDIRRLGSDRFFAISKPSERRSIGINIPGRLGNGGDAGGPRPAGVRWGDLMRGVFL
jgi:hypothetical protein